MVANGNAALGNRTMVGLRALTTTTPALPQKVLKKEGPQKALLDRVERADDDEEKRRKLFREQEEAEDGEETSLTQPLGHSATMRRYDGEAFRRDAKGRPIAPSYGDVDQGNLADAWLLAACAAVAHAQPSTLTKRIRRRTNEDFVVELGRDCLVVSPEFPLEGYADPTPAGQADTLWVALIEKAFALREAGAYALLETGNSARALEALTGERTERLSLSEHLPLDGMIARLKKAKKAGAAMVLKTRAGSVTPPLVADHSYAVLDVIAQGESRKLRLYNPWGTGGGSRPLDSMVHEVDLSIVLQDGEALFVSGV